MLIALGIILYFAAAADAADSGKIRWWSSTYNPAATDVGNVTWNMANLGILRAFDKKAVVKFFNESGGFDARPGRGIKLGDIDEFKWIDLAGDGKLELMTVGSSGPCCMVLGIDRQENLGKISSAGFNGASTLDKTVRDLNGDGKYELILYSYLESDGYQGTTPVAMWPKVYRSQNGNYVEASRDFPDFYDKEVLIQLDQQIRKDQQMRWPTQEVAVLQMERDKILRVLGRNPTAGLRLARQWATSSDPEMIRRASVVFADLGGYEDERRTAVEAYKRALAEEPRSGG